MINYQTIIEAVRKRIVSATEINPLTQLQLENEIFDPKDKDLWISEYCVGGEERQISPKRSRISSFIVEYAVFSWIGTKTQVVNDVINAIFHEFDLSNIDKSSVFINGYAINVTSIKRNKTANKEVVCNSILITLDVVTS